MRTKRQNVGTGGWVGLGAVERRGNRYFRLARCGCGREAVVMCGVDGKLKHDGTCRGCRAEKKTTHGGASTPLYRLWQSVKERCHNPNAPTFGNYGGRGVTVCKRWRDSFAAFREDIGEKPGRGYELDRIDNDRGYEPGNVRWATRVENQNNKRTNHRLTHGGETLTLAEWARKRGCSYRALQQRVLKGWSAEDAVTIPFGDRNASRRQRGVWAPHGVDVLYLEYGGERLTAVQWSLRLGMSAQAIRQRIALGWSVEKALTTPAKKTGRPRKVRT